jgi:transcriptional regulator of acetoin/glycerol metabolism
MFLTTVGDSLGLDELPPEIGMAMRSGKKIANAGYPVTIGKLEDAELESIREALEADHGNLTLVAKHLGIAKSTLYVKLKKYGLDRVVHGVRSSSH